MPARTTHPGLAFWIGVGLRESDGRWLPVADLADEPDVARTRQQPDPEGRSAILGPYR